MSLLIFAILAAIAATIEDAIERHRQRVRWMRRRARRYTFN